VQRKQISVYVDAEDLALLKEIAAGRGVTLAEVIREAIHLTALRNRVWDDPLTRSDTDQGDMP
jgi:hypothetical protein